MRLHPRQHNLGLLRSNALTNRRSNINLREALRFPRSHNPRQLHPPSYIHPRIVIARLFDISCT